MGVSAKIKLITLAVVYMLHVSFFDALMGNTAKDLRACSISSTNHQPSSNNNNGEESSYRLLTKHEQSKQALVSLPDAVDFVSAAFTGVINTQIKQPQFGAFAHLNVSAFKLYRLFRVFLI